MPNRILRADILSSEAIATLKWDEEVFYRRVMSIVDDYGRHEGNPQLLRSKCYPLQTDQVRVADISRWLAACQKAGVILYYDVDGKQYIEVQKFGQKIRTDSKCPAPGSLADKCQQMPANDSLGVCGGEGVCGGVLSNPKGLEVGIPSDPSETPDGKEDESRRRKNCPVTRIVALYHECLPNNPTVEKVTDARAGYIRQRWLDDLPTLDAWKNYFEYVGKSAFLTGRTQGRDGKPPFVADIEFLTKPASFTKTAEGKYHR